MRPPVRGGTFSHPAHPVEMPLRTPQSFVRALVASLVLWVAAACKGDGPTGPALTIVVEPLRAGVVGASYADTLRATGGSRTITWRVLGGALPPGVALASTGVLSGTPGAPGRYTLEVRATSGKRSRTGTFTIDVLPPLAITTATLPAALQSQAYSTTLAASGGTGTYAWSLDADTLPTGLTLSAAGTIAGTPTAYGSDSVDVRVTSGEQVVVRRLGLEVVPALAVTTTALREATVGQAYADTLRAIGAGSGAAWGVASGALPAGLTLLASGVLSGTPTTAGTSAFTAQVTSGTQLATRALEVHVVAALVMTTATLPNGTVGNAYAQTLQASGGIGSYAWSVSAGTLPGGLTLSAAGELGGVPTTASSSTFTLRVVSGAQAVERAFTVLISPPDPARVEITPAADTVELADSVTLAAVAQDAGGVPLPGRPIAWSTLNASVATVSGSGVVRGVTLGTAGIVATTAGAGGVPVADTALVTVVPVPVDSVEVTPGSLSLLIGETAPLAAVLRDRNGSVLSGRTVTWSSSDAAVASVDENTGVVTSGAAGTATITALSEGVTGTATVIVSRGLIVTAITAGQDHSCGLTEAGIVFCWGRNDAGQLGDSSVVGRLTPVRARATATFASISAGFAHTCALTASGQAMCWGSNVQGRLGDGTTTNRAVPTAVSGDVTFASVQAGGTHSCGLTSSGAAYCWGQNGSGQLGDNTLDFRTVPTLVAGGLTFASLSLGANHTCGLTSVGAAYCWGLNASAQLGDGTQTRRIVPTAVLGGQTFTQISAANEHTCAVRADGAAYCWGTNGSEALGTVGRIGDGTTVQLRTEPTAVVGGLTFREVRAGGQHSCGVTTSGLLQCWGVNSSGQLGTGSTTPSTSPVPVAGGFAWDALAVGTFHGCGVRDAGRAFCWGQGTHGKLGDGGTANRGEPTGVRP